MPDDKKRTPGAKPAAKPASSSAATPGKSSAASTARASKPVSAAASTTQGTGKAAASVAAQAKSAAAAIVGAPLALGVPTTTPVAYAAGGVLYLEHMNILSDEGAGIVAPQAPATGTVIAVAFRLSTAQATTRCKGEVLGAVPTTPAGLRLHAEGKTQLPVVPSGSVSDSATAIFRLSDLRPPGLDDGPPAVERPTAAPTGFSVRFVDLDAEGKAALAHHLRTSRALAERLAAQAGRSEAHDRLAIAETFHEGDLSKRALDW